MAFALARRKHRTPIKSLLDVGCATGDHLAAFAKHGIQELYGLDADPQLLQQARAKHKALKLATGDMVDVDLGRKFDAIVSFYGVLAYARTATRLQQLAKNLARHLEPGGVIVAEPWHFKETYQGKPQARHVANDKLAVARASAATKHGNEVHLDVQYLVAQGSKVHHVKEVHKVGLFTKDQVVGAFTQAGLMTFWQDKGPSGLNGVIVAVKPRRAQSQSGIPIATKTAPARSPLSVIKDLVRRGRKPGPPRP